MIGNTNSVIVIGGDGDQGEKICVANYSGTEMNEGDKVLLHLGSLCFEQLSRFDLTATSSTCLNPIAYFNDYYFIGCLNDSRLGSAAEYSFFDGVWHQKANKIFGNRLGSHHLYHCLSNGKIALSPVSYYSSYSGHIIESEDMITIPSNCAYLGEYNDVHYVWSYVQTELCEYDVENNSIGNAIYTASGGYGLTSFLVGNKAYLCRGTGSYFVVLIKEDGTTELLQNATYINFYPLYFVGKGVGDYILATDNLTWYQGTLSTPPGGVTNLVFYRINDDYSLSKVMLPMFRKFYYETCMVSYDARSHVLSVGTKSDVSFYFYDENKHEFVPLSVQLSLPEANGQWCYQPAMSPGFRSVIVGYMTGAYAASYVCYKMAKIDDVMVPNEMENYFALTGYSGVVDEETADGRYEVKTVISARETITVETDETADQVEFMGGKI